MATKRTEITLEQNTPPVVSRHLDLLDAQGRSPTGRDLLRALLDVCGDIESAWSAPKDQLIAAGLSGILRLQQ